MNSMKTDMANEQKQMQSDANDRLKKVFREMDEIHQNRKKDLETLKVDYVRMEMFEEINEVMKLKFKNAE